MCELAQDPVANPEKNVWGFKAARGLIACIIIV